MNRLQQIAYADRQDGNRNRALNGSRVTLTSVTNVGAQGQTDGQNSVTRYEGNSIYTPVKVGNLARTHRVIAARERTERVYDKMSATIGMIRFEERIQARAIAQRNERRAKRG